MEEVFGRHRAEIRSISGVYGAAYEGDEGFAAVQQDIAAFAAAEGRRPRMLVAKMGQDGHDRGAKVDRHRVRRPRLRRRRRPAVPDAGRGGPRRRRERRPRRRRVEPGRRPQDARAAAASTSSARRGAGDVLVVVRRRDPAAGLRRSSTRPAWPRSSARARTSPRRPPRCSPSSQNAAIRPLDPDPERAVVVAGATGAAPRDRGVAGRRRPTAGR